MKIHKNISIYISLIFIPLIFFSCQKKIEKVKIKFIVKTEKDLDQNSIFITGNIEELGNWNPANAKLEKQNDSIWSKEFFFDKGENIEYKFTLGSWQNEASDSLGLEFDNFEISLQNDTVIHHQICCWKNQTKAGALIIDREILNQNLNGISINSGFKYHKGDNKIWASENFDDTNWEISSSVISNVYKPESGFNGIGWYRLHLWVDSTLWGKPVAFYINQLGASEIYFNGKFHSSYGIVSDDINQNKSVQNRIWKILDLENKSHQVIAIRYASYDFQNINSRSFDAGFIIFLKDIDKQLIELHTTYRSRTIYHMVFTIVPFVLALIHFMIFIFYPKEKQNLFYSICLIGFSIIAFTFDQRYISTNIKEILFYYDVANFAVAITVLFGLLTAYSVAYYKIPKRSYVFILLAIIILIWSFKPDNNLANAINLYILISFIEIIIVFIKRTEKKLKGIILVEIGFFLLAFFAIYNILINYGYLENFGGYEIITFYGVLGLAIFMSLYLSYNFALTNKDLANQLENVKLLSQKTLEQEKAAKESEIERRLLEAENDRKTFELEEARKFQLSMLPQTPPEIENFEIAMFMKTAAEVGGDYYDYQISQNNILTLAIGDATGHGAKAGVMVAAAKSLFQAFAGNEPLQIIKTSTKAIKQMKLHNMFMALEIARFENNKLIISNAGMPPVFWFKNENRSVEIIYQKSMPLGSFVNFPYSEKELILNSGDIILFSSDGFIELMNEKNELLGIENAAEIFQNAAQNSFEDIIENLNCECEKWSSSKNVNDDMTFVVIKMK